MKPCPICKESSSFFERILRGIQLAKCPNCSFVYADIPDEQIVQANFHYAACADDYYAAIQNFLDELWFETTASRLTDLLGAGRLLDVGCGNGLLISRFASRGWEVEGLDVSPWAEKYSRIHGYRLHTSEIEANSIAEGSFDLVTSTSTLEHIANPCRHVAAILRVLRPGKFAFFSGIPNYGAATIRMGISAFHDNSPPGHANFFDPVSFRKVFAHPTVGTAVRSIRIRSYGIPEMHWMASHARKMISGIRRTDTTPATSTAHSRLIRLAARTVLKVWYVGGLPFGLGDKLEACIEKK